MKKIIAVVLTLVSCATVTGECITPCGILVHLPEGGPDAGWTCESASYTEQYTLATFIMDVKDPRLTDGCGPFLNGYTLTVRSSPAGWDGGTGYMVSGLTYCDLKTIELNNVPPMDGAMDHEMAHAMQNCIPRDYHPCDAGEEVGSPEGCGQHSDWAPDGISQAQVDVINHVVQP